MGDIKAGEPFGLEATSLAQIDWDLALKRVIHDVRSDFIYAPHLNFLYSRAGDKLIEALKSELKAGNYSPGVPLTIEVPKSFRISVATQIKRLGPNFSRPGSILMPRDRLFYQALADAAVPIIEAKTNSKRSFSHRLAPQGGPAMFLPTRTCWSAMQKALKDYSKDDELEYVVKVDVANFFGSLNQHELINVLSDSGFSKPLHSRLEAILTSFTGDRSSRGILQGMYPSDLFGNFYLAPIDTVLAEHGVPSARYVDDIYVFVKSMNAAGALLRELIPALRSYDLTLNEAKSKIILKSSLIAEEPDLEALFSDAVEEISSQIEDDDFDADYGFQSEWDEDSDDEDEDQKSEDLELKATKHLFDSIEDYAGHEENIERFCLPLFAKAGSNYAVDHVMDAFKKRPAMSQIFSSYLANFLENDTIRSFLIALLQDKSLVDWQKMWVLAALSQVPGASDAYVKVAMDILKDGDRHEALRGAAAVYAGRFGEHPRRKALVSLYASVSPYIQSAVYFSSRNWPGVERSNAKASWGSHNPLNILITAALSKK
jgi:Reverse transcriptase (RNA-dependent DNA polymerase)